LVIFTIISVITIIFVITIVTNIIIIIIIIIIIFIIIIIIIDLKIMIETVAIELEFDMVWFKPNMLTIEVSFALEGSFN